MSTGARGSVVAETVTFPSPMSAPRWVEGNATTTGLDLLALRRPVQVIQGRLLNGITTITPRIRYLSLRTWLITGTGAPRSRRRTPGTSSLRWDRNWAGFEAHFEEPASPPEATSLGRSLGKG